MDLHCQMMMEEFDESCSAFREIEKVVSSKLKELIRENGLYITTLESRVKTGKSLEGKLELKGGKYKTLSDITDLVGLRIVTFYASEVDKIASMVEKNFAIDWENSVDKRKALATDQFGYKSLHYVCSIPESMYSNPACPAVNEYRFEIQLRTALQHVWATVYHDTGYKSDIEVPKQYIRKLTRLAGLLELADEQFEDIITDINEYRRGVRKLIGEGELDDICIDGDSFKSYLEINPFGSLNSRIASINHAEITDGDFRPFLELFKKLEINTLGDIDRMVREYSDDAYHLATMQLGSTDLDILATTVGLRNLCILYVARKGGGVPGLKTLLDTLGGMRDNNTKRAERLLGQLESIGVI